MDLKHLLEPEETIGNAWHRLVGGGGSVSHYPSAAVSFDDMAAQLAVFFRGVGGRPGVELKAATAEVSHHRLDRRTRLGTRAERVGRARYDGERLSLPGLIDVFPQSALNRDLYVWLAAWTAAGAESPVPVAPDALAQDVVRIAHATGTTALVLRRYPGLAPLYVRLRQATLDNRPPRTLPAIESAVESLIRRALVSAAAAVDETLAATAAPKGYRPYLPVPLWGEIETRPLDAGHDRSDEAAGSGQRAPGDGKSRKATRRQSDQVNRKGFFFLHRFEKILTWTEFMNLHRDAEDDDEETAQKAADDHDEIGVAAAERKAATRLAIDLDLSPQDVDAERLSDVHTYPEWDFRRAIEHPDHVRILERQGTPDLSETAWRPGPKMQRRIRAVRRQFEALRPRRELLGRQLDGHELDMDALIRARADLAARGESSDRIYRQAREQARDLSVSVLIDVSRSTESCVDSRAVIDIEREALIALAEGLEACGDEAAINAFSSLRRDRVFFTRLKAFDEKASPEVRARIAALHPGFYTRLGAAIRHASAGLAVRPTRKKLLLILTDGKPNDLDHYEGRYGVEDTRRAVREARRAGQSVFGIAIDRKAESYVAHIFGAGGYAILSHPARLTAALPTLYRHLVA